MENPNNKLVFVIDEHGRTLSQKSLQRLISELFEKALGIKNVDAVVANGPTVNACTYLNDQVTGRDISDWEIIYLHGSKYPPVLLTCENKVELVSRLLEFNGTSAEVIYKVLTDAGAFDYFN